MPSCAGPAKWAGPPGALFDERCLSPRARAAPAHQAGGRVGAACHARGAGRVGRACAVAGPGSRLAPERRADRGLAPVAAGQPGRRAGPVDLFLRLADVGPGLPLQRGAPRRSAPPPAPLPVPHHAGPWLARVAGPDAVAGAGCRHLPGPGLLHPARVARAGAGLPVAARDDPRQLPTGAAVRGHAAGRGHARWCSPPTRRTPTMWASCRCRRRRASSPGLPVSWAATASTSNSWPRSCTAWASRTST